MLMAWRMAALAAIAGLILYQFIGHQYHLYYPPELRIAFFVAVVAVTLPYLVAIFVREPSITPLPKVGWAEHGLVLLIAAVFWAAFVAPLLGVQPHAYGDESHHLRRILVEITYWRTLFTPTPAPIDGPFFVFYPAVGYIPSIVLTWIGGDGEFSQRSAAMARAGIVVWYLATVFIAHAVSRQLEFRTRVYRLVAVALVASIPVLLAYQDSLYVELQYVPLQLAALYFAFEHIKEGRQRSLWLAIGFAAVSCIVRESAWPFAFCLAGCLGLWRFFERRTVMNFLYSGILGLAALGPFLLYFAAQQIYSGGGRGASQLAFEHIFKQDWLALAIEAPRYMTVALVIALPLAFYLFPRLSKAEKLVVFGICVPAIGLTLFEYGLFFDKRLQLGWMPWSRNYLMWLAPGIFVFLVAAKHAANVWSWKIAAGAAGVCGVLNLSVLVFSLRDDRHFFENEAVFPVAELLARNSVPETAIIYDCRPAWYVRAEHFRRFENFCPPETAQFQQWAEVKGRVPAYANYVLFYHYRNNSKPGVLAHLAAADMAPGDDEAFRTIATVNSPVAFEGRTGVSLLQRRQAVAEDPNYQLAPDPGVVAARQERDATRLKHAATLRDALARFKAAKGAYPNPFGDNLAGDLQDQLSAAGVLQTVPHDPVWGGGGQDYRYVSPAGDRYALRIYLEEAHGAIPAGGACLIGDGYEGTGWYAGNGAQPPPCPL